MVKDIQSRKFQVTINNPEKHGYKSDLIKEKLETIKSTYFCFSNEVGEQGTEHTHIFIFSESPIRFSTIKNLFPEAHIEKSYGSLQENKDYLLKEGKWKRTSKAETRIEGSFYESAELPEEESSKKNIMVNVMDDLRSGNSVMSIIQKYPSLAFKSNDLYSLREQLLCEEYETENRQIKVIYCYGDSGTGKTSNVYSENKGERICRITSYDNGRALFDNYRSEDILVFEEFHSQIKLPDMLSYLDVYPLTLPARYNNRIACYTKVYILSNLPLNRQYEYEQKTDFKTWNAFLRRISEIRHFQKDFTYIVETVGGTSSWTSTNSSPFSE